MRESHLSSQLLVVFFGRFLVIPPFLVRGVD
jgi:hypothetical protein